MSLTVALTAESGTKALDDDAAMSRAMVVFPVPGGPQRITELQPIGVDEGPQRFARSEQLVLADDLVEACGVAAGRPEGRDGSTGPRLLL